MQIPLDRLLPTRSLAKMLRSSPKFLCIQASIRELGLIEPLVVFPQKGSDGMHVILDGHIRHSVLKEMGIQSAKCLIATDDEGFTYNHKVNRLSAIQEHFMIAKAIKNGASEERIARTLNVDLTLIRQKRGVARKERLESSDCDGVSSEATGQCTRRSLFVEQLPRNLQRVSADRRGGGKSDRIEFLARTIWNRKSSCLP